MPKNCQGNTAKHICKSLTTSCLTAMLPNKSIFLIKFCRQLALVEFDPSIKGPTKIMFGLKASRNN